ncbi:MAG: DNA gyrase inhibitor YacG [Planctomycetes bacterium]|nr:DNA gyrase inhibitor YacG [Planctomycetota bacterium]
MDPPFACPICKAAVTPELKTFPFCSERCRLLDLGAWLDERYRVARPLASAAGAAKGVSEDGEEGGPGAGESDVDSSD